MEALGWRVTIGGTNKKNTNVTIQGEEIPIAIEERVKRSEHILTPKEEREKARFSYSYAPKWDYHPTGELSLRIKEYGGDGIRKNCSDITQLRLEERLAEFLEIVRRFAAHELMERRQREREAQKRADEQARLAELQAQLEAEKRRVQDLEEEVGAWHKAKRIRAFVEAARQARRADESWARWATEYANQIDPLQHGA
jgi:hypothetical protein